MRTDSPIIINVPHSSTYIPSSELEYFTTPHLMHELSVMTDHYCDDLFDVGYEMIRFPISRLVCDVERFRDDEQEIMSSVGMGAIYTHGSDGKEIRKISAEHKEELLKKYYDPYHKQLEEAVERKLDQFGKCLIIDGHSFYDEPLPYEKNQNEKRPRICIGTDKFHTPDIVYGYLNRIFYLRCGTVDINNPFAGSIVPMKYYQKDPRVMSAMIEVNRKVYMDHNLNKKIKGYNRLKDSIRVAVNIVEDIV